MTETRAIAHLPTLDIEFARRELPAEGAERGGHDCQAFEAFSAALCQELPAMMAMSPALFWFGCLAPGCKGSGLHLPAAARDDDRVSERRET